mmetsp:Transcript_23314/g.59152  ORF Transcript_23314/g.59152 Transcript_23314/m.59152 type:complete len:139 (+) Transcript_23314:375-791(+)
MLVVTRQAGITPGALLGVHALRESAARWSSLKPVRTSAFALRWAGRLLARASAAATFFFFLTSSALAAFSIARARFFAALDARASLLDAKCSRASCSGGKAGTSGGTGGGSCASYGLVCTPRKCRHPDQVLCTHSGIS